MTDPLPPLQPPTAKSPGPDPEPTTPSTPRRRPAWLATVAVPAVVGAAAAFGVGALTSNDGGRTVTVVQTSAGAPATTTATPAQTSTPGDTTTRSGSHSVQQIVAADSPGVVAVQTGTDTNGSLGTGFLIDTQGHIVTNAHVVPAGTTSITVGFKDGTQESATLVGRDETEDVAVLKIANIPSSARVVPMGTVRTLQVGDPLIAIGNPLGYTQTVTTGIVSALKRVISSPNDSNISNVIQTDAPITHGNSGGPLIDSNGRVVGINSQIATDSGSNVGIGFAVPIDIVKPVVASIISGGTAQHAWIGIQGATVTPDVAKANGLGSQKGVMVVKVDSRGPAKTAGLKGATSGTGTNDTPKGGDVIVAVNGQTTNDMGDVSLNVASQAVGATVHVTVLRNGKKLSIDVPLANRPADVK
ncbi:MAG: trypsin-like peptidase domain-containing protein [Thermoleophilia bacterium]